ncbi:hypothetical protein PCK1_002313 [Pneumocystis canis]|nr:hypothetical protein PCK1_002313 [Pneumocystis canis]
MSTRIRAEKGRFIPGSSEFDIIPQKWRQEWVERQISSKNNKIDTHATFKTLCWVPVKDVDPSESLGKHPEPTPEETSTSLPSSAQENI